MMKANEEHMHETDSPQLRVFWGEEEGKVDDRRPPDLSRQARRDWLRSEAFWAGRNRAGRHSARLVA
jgi:hypothetical protein